MGRKWITIDCFADNTNHKCKHFYSKYLCPGSKGVNAYYQTLPLEAEDGKPTLALMNGDFKEIARTFQYMQEQRVNTILVYPDNSVIRSLIEAHHAYKTSRQISRDAFARGPNVPEIIADCKRAPYKCIASLFTF